MNSFFFGEIGSSPLFACCFLGGFWSSPLVFTINSLAYCKINDKLWWGFRVRSFTVWLLVFGFSGSSPLLGAVPSVCRECSRLQNFHCLLLTVCDIIYLACRCRIDAILTTWVFVAVCFWLFNSSRVVTGLANVECFGIACGWAVWYSVSAGTMMCCDCSWDRRCRTELSPWKWCHQDHTRLIACLHHVTHRHCSGVECLTYVWWKWSSTAWQPRRWCVLFHV